MFYDKTDDIINTPQIDDSVRFCLKKENQEGNDIEYLSRNSFHPCDRLKRYNKMKLKEKIV